MADSIFTKIINREIPAEIVYEDDDVIAFNDISPKAPVHVLVVPKKHIITLNDADETDAALLGKVILTASKIAKEKGIADRGYRIVVNCNQEGGQSVYHIHFHLIGGKQLGWSPD
ncbi:MAG: histidine triad nucleotide-binding protein [Candidatus Kapabacteria bacterium]|nr:histidine triad nucleotide-binding protein [Ignavibacteriota bacterium]MCW5884366.1 histidine triad nucleotide-binding protein [Candidatus Kapabacteria bacterium]